MYTHIAVMTTNLPKMPAKTTKGTRNGCLWRCVKTNVRFTTYQCRFEFRSLYCVSSNCLMDGHSYENASCYMQIDGRNKRGNRKWLFPIFHAKHQRSVILMPSLFTYLPIGHIVNCHCISCSRSQVKAIISATVRIITDNDVLQTYVQTTPTHEKYLYSTTWTR